MHRIYWLLGGVVLGVLLTVGSQNYHLIRTKDGLTCLPKRHSTLAETYIDVREWGVAEWGKHPDLLWTLVKHERTDIPGSSQVLDANVRDVWQMFDAKK